MVACFILHMLLIQYEYDMFKEKWPFSVEEVSEIVLILKQYLIAAICVKTNGCCLTGKGISGKIK